MRGKDLIAATLFGGAGGGSSGGGGGSVAVSPKEVNFYDYDGTCVHAYTVAEAQALSELPAGPEHPGLVFQGWNWSLEGVKALTRAMNIGAMYTTDDGTTRLYITLQEGRTSPMLGVGVNGTVTVDWGDGTEPDVLTGTSVGTTVWTPNHAYEKPGDYVIRLAVDGVIRFRGSNNRGEILRHDSSSSNLNEAYTCAVQKIEFGEGINSFGDTAFRMLRNLATVSVPNLSCSFQASMFNECNKLRYVTSPANAQQIPSTCFANCYSLERVSIGEKVYQFGSSVFSGAYTLVDLTIPDGVTLGDALVEYTYILRRIGLPQDATVVPYRMMNISRLLTCVNIPGTIVEVKSEAFRNCSAVVFYDFTKCAAVPSLANTDAFTGIPADCEIRVPAALYDEWIAATNWATYASKIKAY